MKSMLRIFVMEPTGEYRRPKKGEWFIGLNDWPIQTNFGLDHEYHILSVTIKPYEEENHD